jgi:ATP-dependent HslUV protease ATP-binding subunit HslU
LRGDKKYTQQIASLKVKEIRKHMYDAYLEDLFGMIDIEQFVKDEIENKGIVVIDEIDKLVRSPDATGSTKASDEGVQYDMLPLLDGTTISINTKTKVNTRNILFVGAGAFEKTKPSDLAIELQGRMPVRAKMEPLSLEDFKHILSRTEHNLLVQSVELLKIEGLNIVFDAEAIDEMAKVAVELNEEDNTGARRLRTVVDAVLEEINYEAPDFEQKDATIVIGADYVKERTKQLYANRDFRQYTM